MLLLDRGFQINLSCFQRNHNVTVIKIVDRGQSLCRDAVAIYSIRFASRKIRHGRESKSGVEKCGAPVCRESIGHFDARNTRELVSFLVVTRVWREIWRMMFPEDEKEGERERERIRGNDEEKERTETGQERREGRILRSACKPISISSEIRLSEFLAARVPRSRPRGPQLVYWPLACPRACRDSKFHPIRYVTYTQPFSNHSDAI